jgi:PAS domain S-box-containing protein
MKPALPLLIVLLAATHAGSGVTAETQRGEEQAAAPAVRVQDPAHRPRRVLALYWYPSDHPVTETFNRQFNAVLARHSGGDVEYFAEYFESARFPGETQAHIMRDYLHQKYSDRKIDALLAWGAEPLEFLLTYRHDLFPDTPIVFYIGTLEAVKRFAEPGLTGVYNPDAYEKTFELALRLHPDATRAYIISGTPRRDKMIEREASQQLQKYEGRIALTYLTDVPLDQLIARVKNIPKHSIILFSRQSVQNPDTLLLPSDFLNLLSRSAPVPIYCPWRSLAGHGAVGGVVDDPEGGAADAAEMVLRVAQGTRPQDIPVEHVPTIPTFDARQLSRWGISEAELPRGSVVLFREPTIWSQYRSYIIATGIVLSVQTLLIGALLVQRVRRRRMESALRESEERFRLMADTAPVMIWRSGTDKAADFFNLPWLEFRGRSAEEEAGLGWTKGIHPDDRDKYLDTYSAAFDERRPFRIEYRLRRADGVYRWILASGVPRFGPDAAFAGYIGSGFDITERRKAEEALQTSEKRYALATMAGSVGVWDWDLSTDDIWIDPALKRALGYEAHEIDNRLDSWLSHVHPDDRGSLLMHVYAHANGETPSFEHEHRMLHRDGSIRWFLSRGSAVQMPGGGTDGIIGTDTDITERKNTEITLEESRHELARVSRVTTLTQFAASVAHEASQPLSTILFNARACLTWLKNAPNSIDDLRSALQDIVGAAKQANEVIIRNRGMFSRHGVDKQPVDANSIVHDVVALARTRLDKERVHLETILEADLPAVIGDRVELQQVLLNLLLNGIEAVDAANPASRRIWIRTSLTDSGQVQISVRDTGVGLHGVDLDNLFTAFYTTKPTGTGVGLSISHFIVTDHGGRLWAEHNSDGGATFSFTLPVAQEIESHEPDRLLHGQSRR